MRSVEMADAMSERARPEGHNSREPLSARGRRPDWMREKGLTVPEEGVASQQIRWQRCGDAERQRGWVSSSGLTVL